MVFYEVLKLILETLYDVQKLINNVQDNFVSFHTQCSDALKHLLNFLSTLPPVFKKKNILGI